MPNSRIIVFEYTLLAIITGFLLFTAPLVFAQTENFPEGVTQEQIDAALADISAMYGSPVVRIDQAKAICNDEQYFVQCAEIGKKHGLFDDERIKQVDTLVEELKGDVVEKLANCTDVECLVEVATSLARQLNREHPAVAAAVDLTPDKVDEKRAIVDTAKEIGVDFEACRTMDPDTASVELLRGCARLAKDVRIQGSISEEMRGNIEKNDASIALKESLASGTLQCGDGTLDGCGSFCLNPSPEARMQGITAIPPVCHQIAERFFGSEGISHLEEAYTSVQRAFDSYTNREGQVFTTHDGRTLTSMKEIGRYLEEAGQRGDVDAVRKGMDFMVANGFASSDDRDFAIKMIQKVKERGSVNFEDCRSNPEQCRDFVPDDHREQFAAMGEVEKIMRAAMRSLGIDNPSQCEFDPAIGERCMEAAKSVIPQLEALVARFPEVRFMIKDLQQKVRFGEEGLLARGRTEERMRSGSFRVGDKEFRSMSELEAFCRENSHECLAEMTRAGMFARDVASEKYRHSAERQYTLHDDPFMPDRFFPEDRRSNMNRTQMPYDKTFDKDAAMKQFEAWLDNPTGPPPVPPMRSRYDDRRMTDDDWDPRRPSMCPIMDPLPCPAGEYRQEHRNQYGCMGFGACIPVDTKTGKQIDGKFICPAMPTVDSCPAGEEKVISYSSPECGTYYECRPKRTTETRVNFPYTFKSGKVTPSYEAARSYCYESGPYGATARGDVGECTAPFGFSVPTIPPEKQCSHYGDGWHTMDQSGNCFNTGMTEYRTPGGTLQQCSSAPVYGCTNMNDKNGQQGQKEQVWNNLGLRSWIRDDADPARIDSLKQACAQVQGSANVWKPTAGDYASVDFGMPEASKCTKAAACTASQNFNGTECVTGGSQSCPAGQYWNGSTCVDSSHGTTTPPTCPTGQYWNGNMCATSGSENQVLQIWNNLGLQSYVKKDADPARVNSLKQSCANVRSSSNVWMPGAGSQTSSDFGMPDPVKCEKAAACTSEQTFDGASCITGGSTSTGGNACRSGTAAATQSSCQAMTGCVWYSNHYDGSHCDDTAHGTSGTTQQGDANSCPGFAYSRWDSTGKRYCQLNTETRCDYDYPSYMTNGANYTVAKCPADAGTNNTTGSCSSELTNLLGYGCHNMGNAWFNSAMTQYVMPGTTVVKNCSTDSISGCSGGSGSTSGSCPSYTSQSTCVQNSSCNWNTTSNYCAYNSSSSSCPSGQYWNGSSCVNNTTTGDSCSAELTNLLGSGCHSMSGGWFNSGMTQYVLTGTTVVKSCSTDWVSGCSGGSSTSGSCSSYTSQSSCTATSGCSWSSSSNSCSYTSSTTCPSGQYWNGSACVNTSTTDCPSGQYWNGSACVPNTTTTCPTGQHMEGGVCVNDATTTCPTGQYWNGSSCVPNTTTTTPEQGCVQAGGTWDPATSSCKMPTTYFCPSGHGWTGSHCTFAQRQIEERNVASVLRAIMSILGL